jgi:hypothetical protein
MLCYAPFSLSEEALLVGLSRNENSSFSSDKMNLLRVEVIDLNEGVEPTKAIRLLREIRRIAEFGLRR